MMRTSLLFPAFLSLSLAACATVDTAHEHDVPGDHADMTMEDMVADIADKEGDAFDEAFLRAMIPHHQGAIDMAEIVKLKAQHPELKAMADDIITAQQREIDQMHAWLRAWGYER